MATHLLQRLQASDNTFSIFSQDGTLSLDIRNAGFASNSSLNITNATASTTTSTGALIVTGGTGIGGALNVGGISSLTNTTDASSSTVGGTIISGGLAVAKKAFIGDNLSVNSLLAASGLNTISLFSNNGNARVSIVDEDISLSKPPGVRGIAGLGLGLYSHGDAGNNDIKMYTKEALRLTIEGATGNVSLTSTTASTSTTTGSLIAAGGVGIAGALNVGGLSTLNSLLVDDNLIIINSSPASGADSGFLIKRYQTANNSSSGDIVADTAVESGTAQAGGSATTIVLASDESAVDDFYNGYWIKITSGTASGNVRKIKDYNGTTKTATIYGTGDTSDGLNFTANPDATSAYSLHNNIYGVIAYDESTDRFTFGHTFTDPGSTPITYNRYLPLHSGSLNVTNTNALSTSSIFLTNNSETNTAEFGWSNLSSVTFVKSNAALEFHTNAVKRIDIGSAGNIVVDSSSSLTLQNTTASTTTSTGALVVTGGTGIGGALNIGGVIKTTDTTASSSTTTGSGIFAGGVGIAGDVNIGGSTLINNDLYISASGDNLVICADVSTGGRMGFVKKTGLGPRLACASGQDIRLATTSISNLITGNVSTATITDRFILNTTSTQLLHTTASTTTSDGALVVSGGVGIAGAVNAGGAIKTTDTTASSSTTTGSGIFAGGVGIAGTLNVLDVSLANGGNVYTVASGDNTCITADSIDYGAGVGGRMGFVKQGGAAQPIIACTSGKTIVLATANISNLISESIGGATFTNRFTVDASQSKVLQTTVSTSTTTGALTVAGGTGIAGALYVGGISNLTDTTDASSSTVGGTVVSGGLAVAKKVFTGDNLSVNSLSTASNLNAICTFSNNGNGRVNIVDEALGTSRPGGVHGTAGLGLGLYGGDIKMYTDSAATLRLTIADTTGNVSITSSTASTTTSTGALVITGGTGIGGALNVGGIIKTTDTTASSSTTTGSLIAAGGLGVAGAVNVGGIIKTTDTTASSSTTTGSLIAAGGVGIAGAVNVGGAFNVASSKSGTPSTTGPYIAIGASTFTDNNTAISGTATSMVFNSIAQPTLAATNTSVTTTTAATMYIAGGPLAGTNETITRSYGIWNAGKTLLDGNLDTSSSVGNYDGAAFKCGYGGYIAGYIATNNTDGSIATYSSSIALTRDNLFITTVTAETYYINRFGDSSLKSLSIEATTASTSTTTGALIVDGGAGIAGAVNVGGIIKTTDTTASSSTTTGSLIAAGGLGVAGAVNVGGIIKTTDTTASSSTTTGSLIAAGGLGVAGAVNIGTTLYTGGNIGVGTSTNVNQALTLAANSNIALNTLDGTDNGVLTICGGGSSSTARGAYISVCGNEQTSPGLIAIVAGNTSSNGRIEMTTNDIIRLSIGYNGGVNLPTTTASTSTTTGALTVAGGAGIAGALNVGGAFNVASSKSGTPSTTGPYIAIGASTFTDNNTAISGTATSMVFNSIAQPTLAATNTSVTTTTAATMYIAGGPAAGTNETITNSYGLWNVGKTLLDGSLKITDTTVSSSTTTGSLITAGGAGIAGALYVGGNADIGGGTTTFSNGTSNTLIFNTNGVNPPAFTSRSAGTKIVLYPAIDASHVDFAIGIQVDSMWYSVDNSSKTHRFYTGTTDVVDITGTGMTINATTASTTTTTGALTVAGGTGIAGNLNVGGVFVLPHSTVTQATSITTGVTISGSSGIITTVSTTLAAASSATFTVTQANVTTSSVVVASIVNYSGAYFTNGTPTVNVSNIASGAFDIIILNTHASNALNGVLKISFIVV